MTSFRFLLVSTAPCFAWAFGAGCGSGGGFRGATLTHDDGGSQNATSGSSGMNAGGAGAEGASEAGAGAGGLSADAGAGAGGEDVGAGQAGVGGASAGVLGTGGVAGDASAGASGSSIVAGAGPGGGAGVGASGATGGSMTSGGAAGAGGDTSGAGSGGSAGSDGPLATCAERCSADIDCRIFGADQGYSCNPATQRCETFAEPCRSSLECVPEASLWLFDCTNDADCFFFGDDLCVDVGGIGRCARLAPSTNDCAEPTSDEIMLPRFGVSDSALVCANTSRTCFEGACVPGCSTSADCTPARNGSVCDQETRLCRCVRDADCGGIGVSRCNTATGRCECTDSLDCEEVPNTNTCSAGRCGCAAVSACTVERTFSGTTYVCE